MAHDGPMWLGGSEIDNYDDNYEDNWGHDNWESPEVPGVVEGFSGSF